MKKDAANYTRRSAISQWADEDKPREKMLAHGIRQLTDAELLAIILGSGSGQMSAVDLARTILQQYNSKLKVLSRAEVDELITRFHGVGTAKAVSIKAALELGHRMNEESDEKKVIISESRNAYELVSKHLYDLKHEECWSLFLNQRNQLLELRRMTSGGIAGTVVDVRLILKRALELSATGIILCHNHPSGSIQPSRSDTEITKKLKNAASYMDIRLLDHLIVASDKYYSYGDEGTLNGL